MPSPDEPVVALIDCIKQLNKLCRVDIHERFILKSIKNYEIIKILRIHIFKNKILNLLRSLISKNVIIIFGTNWIVTFSINICINRKMFLLKANLI